MSDLRATAITYTVLPPVDALRDDVEYFRIAEYVGSEGMHIMVCPNGLPGIVFHHGNGQSAVRSIVTNSGRVVHVPTLFLYGQVTELAVMNFQPGPFISVQAVLKPHALWSLFGIDASVLTNGSWWYPQFASETLHTQLLSARSGPACVDLLSTFLLAKLEQAHPRDPLVEESLRLIHDNISSITVRSLLAHLHISERQFQKRFVQSVGVSLKFYIRVKRFNEAIRLMDTGQYERLSDVAHALHFHDQSHFIRDMKVFSGITPRSISQKVNSFRSDEIGSWYYV